MAKKEKGSAKDSFPQAPVKPDAMPSMVLQRDLVIKRPITRKKAS